MRMSTTTDELRYHSINTPLLTELSHALGVSDWSPEKYVGKQRISLV